MSFKDIILFTINFVRKSLQIELNDFFENIKNIDENYTKQAFSEARQKISPQAFMEMSNAVVSWYYKNNQFKTFKGIRVTAIDGMVIELNNSPRLRETFGYIENQTQELWYQVYMMLKMKS